MSCWHKNMYYLLAWLSTVTAVFMCSTVNGVERPNVKILFPDVADFDFQNESLAVMTNSNIKFELLCHASYPVEWIFHYSLEDDGVSEKTKLATTHRHVSNFTDVKSYKFTAKLRMEYKGKLFSLANFTCRHAERNSGSGKDLMTHVVMSGNQIMSMITLQITNNLTKPAHQDLKGNKNCTALAEMGRLPKDKMPCYKCVVPKTGEMLKLDFLRCYTPIECESMYSRQNKGTSCLRRLGSPPPHCSHANPHFFPTILVCKNYGLVLAQFYFFGVFRGNRNVRIPDPGPPIYYNWVDVDPTEMLYLHPFRMKILYTGQQVKFTCEYSRYYFSLGSWFGIKNSEETVYLKAKDLKPCDTDVDKKLRTDHCTLNQTWRGTFMASLNTSFDQVGPHEVFCLGPVWNSTEWINTSVSFYVEKSEPPKVVSLLPHDDNPFVVGQMNRKLICKVKGRPIPKITWRGPRPINESMYKSKALDNFTSEITFIEIGYKTCGVYICTATSYLGRDDRSFMLITRSDYNPFVIAIVAFSVIMVILIAVAVLIMVRMRGIIRKQQTELRLLTEAELEEFVQGKPDVLESHRNTFLNNATAIDALPYDKKYEIPVENLIIEFSKILGVGQFGVVFKGKVTPSSAFHYVNLADTSNSDADIDVAVKVSKGNLDVTNFKALLAEIKVMAYLGAHKNIASLVGASTENIQNRELYIAVEYCHNGSLDKFLKKHKSEFEKSSKWGKFTVKNLWKWSVDIADGIEHIHGKKIIHGDLAIRNVLLTKDFVAKVGDFGLSRQLTESSSYTKTTKGALPWRSMAIESLKSMEFSVKSDMWAYGITLWELFTLGDTPYPGITYTLEFPSFLERGLRLYKPPLASNAIYDYMLMCWSKEPNDRPGTNDFKNICLGKIN